MAHEYLLKMIVNGLESLATDNETLFEHLNLRALFHDFAETFEGATFTAPKPPYPCTGESQAQAADLVGRVADNTALVLQFLGGTPAPSQAFDGQIKDADLLRLILDWGTLQSGVYKSIVQLYGRKPAPAPDLPNPGASSEERLWAEIVAWLEKMAADTDLLTVVQHIAPTAAAKKKAARTAPPPLGLIEQGVHRATLNTLQIAGLLPHHLYHAAHPDQPELVRG